MKKNAKKASDTFDWPHADAMTEEEIHAAALADPDAQPLTEEQLAQMKPVCRARLVRMKLRLTQEEFARRYGIPLSTLRDWEQYRAEQAPSARARLANDAGFMSLALQDRIAPVTATVLKT